MNKLLCFCLIISSIAFYSLFSMKFESDDAIKAQLQEMVKKDQEIRSRINVKNPDEGLFAEMVKIDAENIGILKEMLQKCEWITISRFGKQADDNAWLIAQHASFDSDFQREILAKLERLYPLGETSAKNYAYLYDRVAANQGQPQRYGTQGKIKEGKWVLSPVEDPENLDKRRSEVGLIAYQEYVCQLEKAYNLS